MQAIRGTATSQQIELNVTQAEIPSTGNLWLMVKCAQTGSTSGSGGSCGVTSTSPDECSGLSGCTFNTRPYTDQLGQGEGGDVAWNDPYDYSSSAFEDTTYTAHLWAEIEEIADVSGTGDGTLPALTGSGTGTFLSLSTGTGAGTLPTLTSSGTGTFTQVALAAPADGVTTYSAVLSADGYADYSVPISNAQLRLRQSPSQCYVSVTIPSITTYIDAILDRSDGEITLSATHNGVTTELITANLDRISTYYSARSATAIVTAYKQVTWSSPQTRTLSGIAYEQSDQSTNRIRASMTLAFPGDAFLFDGRTFVADAVSILLRPTGPQLEMEGAFL